MQAFFAFTFAVVLVGSGCASHQILTVPAFDKRYPEEVAWIRQELETASLVDGVSREEAQKLVISYWTRFCSRCGMPDSVKDAGDYWKARVYTGYIAVRDGDILIHKTTGAHFMEGWPLEGWPGGDRLESVMGMTAFNSAFVVPPLGGPRF